MKDEHKLTFKKRAISKYGIPIDRPGVKLEMIFYVHMYINQSICWKRVLLWETFIREPNAMVL